VSPPAPATRIAALDWLKALGITIIVWGHVIGLPSLNAVSPIYLKQFGVAFFCFVTGYTVMRDRRPGPRLVARRLVEPWSVGVGAAIVLSIIAFLRAGTIQKSNYVPFVGGVNVFWNFFPANPTTWYLGCYLHILIAAVCFRRIARNWSSGAIVAVSEIVARTALLTTNRLFMTYMLLPNWTACIALGSLAARNRPRDSAMILGGVAAVVTALWVRPIGGTTFPFMLPSTDLATLFRASAAITLLYTGMTAVGYGAATLVKRPLALVTLIADHTLLIFIIHMPLYYVLPRTITGHPRTFVHGVECFLLCLIIPLLFSMWLTPILPFSRRRPRTDIAYTT
jgi:fucose 4-O-acetylase-like acetyltransferase